MGPFLPGTEPPSFIDGEGGESRTTIDYNMSKPWNLTEGQRQTFTIISTAAFPTLALAQGLVAWKWGKDGQGFGIKSEGWFGKDTYSGGADKTGHMTSHYIQKRFYTGLSQKLGWDHRTSQNHGLIAAGLTGLMIELGDGFSRYQFCPQDLLADAVGIGFAWLLDEYPKLDELMGLRWEYWPSKNWFDKRNSDKLDVNSDYSGQKFFFTLKAKGIPTLAEKWYTRYLTVDLGFYTRGYKPDFSVNPNKNNSQWFTYGVGINLGSLIADFGPKNTVGDFFSTVTKYWIPPGTVYTGNSSITQGPEKY